MDWFSTTGPAPSGIPFAIDAEGRWRDVSDVERGLACGCVCAACKGRLVAKKGTEKIHHFAHHDRRDCRHALEASLYGMLVDLLVEPDACLLIPPYIERVHLLKGTGIPAYSKRYREFAERGWVFDPMVVTAQGGFKCTAPTLDQCTDIHAEFVDEASRLEIHVLSYRKKHAALLAIPPREGWLRVGLNLRAYANLWWDTCDQSAGETLVAATKARARLKDWLMSEQNGRGILYHPDEAAKKAKFQVWVSKVAPEEAARARAQQDALERQLTEHEHENHKWTIPHDPSQPGSGKVWQRLDKSATGTLSQWLGHQVGLYRAPDGDGWAYVAFPGERVPQNLRRFMKPMGPWLPWPLPESEPHGKSQFSPSPPTEDMLLESSVGTCSCGAPLNRVRCGSGIWRGRVVEQCARNVKHPIKIVGEVA